jgi:hypothetical protein
VPFSPDLLKRVRVTKPLILRLRKQMYSGIVDRFNTAMHTL